MISRLIFSLTAVLLLSACANTRVVPISTERYSPRAEEEVRLFVSDIARPYKEIAFVQSFSDRSTDPETRRRQLEQMRRNAARIGADAIINIRPLQSQVRGIVVDEAVPFRAYRQGQFELTFLRGTAVRFVVDDGFVPEELDFEGDLLSDDPLAFTEE